MCRGERGHSWSGWAGEGGVGDTVEHAPTRSVSHTFTSGTKSMGAAIKLLKRIIEDRRGGGWRMAACTGGCAYKPCSHGAVSMNVSATRPLHRHNVQREHFLVNVFQQVSRVCNCFNGLSTLASKRCGEDIRVFLSRVVCRGWSNGAVTPFEAGVPLLGPLEPLIAPHPDVSDRSGPR